MLKLAPNASKGYCMVNNICIDPFNTIFYHLQQFWADLNPFNIFWTVVQNGHFNFNSKTMKKLTFFFQKKHDKVHVFSQKKEKVRVFKNNVKKLRFFLKNVEKFTFFSKTMKKLTFFSQKNMKKFMKKFTFS